MQVEWRGAGDVDRDGGGWRDMMAGGGVAKMAIGSGHQDQELVHK